MWLTLSSQTIKDDYAFTRLAIKPVGQLFSEFVVIIFFSLLYFSFKDKRKSFKQMLFVLKASMKISD